jgi:Rrf2 family transcriptional regulator, nitric oxide-sensitive transcriptional repressor
MRVTLHTDYALRVLMYVATKGDKLSTIAEIAAAYGISKNHMMKVVHYLGKRGYLETVRGHGGGLRLLRKPAQINVGKVVRETEEELDVIGCLGEKGYCRVERVCVLRHAFSEAAQAFIQVLDGYTLEDLIKPQTSLASLLGIDAAA